MKLIPLFLFLILSQGCTTKDVHVSIALPEDAAPTGPLSEVSQKDFSSVRILDSRSDKARIGYRRNSVDEGIADILPDDPIEDVVRKAVEETLVKNGHRISDRGIRVLGEIKVFWVESDTNFWGVEYIGQIECELVFSTENGELYRNYYVGSYNYRSRAGLFANPYPPALNGALNSLAEDIAYDAELAAALSQ